MSGEEPQPPGEEAHDVLAAEAFAVPGPDPALRHAPIALPDDPSGIVEPHDVLAAEEFAMPAPRDASSPGSPAGRIAAKAPKAVRIVTVLAVALGIARVLRRRRRA